MAITGGPGTLVNLMRPEIEYWAAHLGVTVPPDVDWEQTCREIADHFMGVKDARRVRVRRTPTL